MISSGFAKDEPVIDVHDDFGGGLGKIHEKRLSLERENQNTCLLSREQSLASVQNLITYKGSSWGHRPTSSTANIPSTRYHVPGITHDVRRAICTR